MALKLLGAVDDGRDLVFLYHLDDRRKIPDPSLPKPTGKDNRPLILDPLYLFERRWGKPVLASRDYGTEVSSDDDETEEAFEERRRKFEEEELPAFIESCKREAQLLAEDAERRLNPEVTSLI